MPYVSAKYLPTDPLMPEGSPRPVQAIDAEGIVWVLQEDSLVGDWVDYVASGGAIAPADEPEEEPEPPPPEE
jgi:hypothetical protein